MATKQASGFKARLKQMQDRWAQGKDEMPGVPEGVYTMQLQSAEMKETGAGKLAVKREHLVMDGEYEGEVVYDQLNLETDYGPYFASQWIEQMGYEPPEELTDLEDIVQQIAAAHPQYQAKVRRNDGFSNVNFVRLLDAGDVEEVEEEVEEASEEEEVDLAVLSRSELKALIKDMEMEIVVTKKMSDDDIRAAIEEAMTVEEEEEEEAEPEEEEEEAEPEEEEEDGDEDEARVGLIEFAQTMDIEVNEDAELNDIVETLKEYEFTADTLTEDEAALLESHGIEVVKPAPAKKAAPKPKPAPAKTKTAAAPSKGKAATKPIRGKRK